MSPPRLALTLVALAGCGGTAGAPDATPVDAAGTGDPSHSVILWKGLDHEWLRDVLGFRVPHRVSKLISRVDEDAASPTFHVGQATGVDGNYMKPVGYLGRVASPDLFVVRGAVDLAWTDDGDGATYPQAATTLARTIDVELSSAALGGGVADDAVVVLTGIDLDSQCDDALQPPGEPCNSNGMWPFHVRFAVGACAGAGTARTCPLDVEIARAWTPNLGGLPPIEQKPFNDRLTFALTVHYAVIAGSAAALQVTRDRLAIATTGHADDRHAGTREVAGVAAAYPAATFAVTGFGFTLDRLPSQTAAKFGHRGRYLGALRFGIGDDAYDAATGVARWSRVAEVWMPDTVEDSGVELELDVALLQLGPGATVAADAEVTGSLCQNSDGAPDFSAWTHCGEPTTGPEQDEDVLPL